MGIILKLSSIMKRSIMPVFDRDYVEKRLARRKGQCKRCGQCCRGCPHLDEKTRLCTTYGNRPAGMCFKEFPLDPADQKAWGIEDCGYSFD